MRGKIIINGITKLIKRYKLTKLNNIRLIKRMLLRRGVL